jgi:hypothetical protein
VGLSAGPARPFVHSGEKTLEGGIRGATANPVLQEFFAVHIPQLAPDEPLSPELVLVLPPELRAAVLAGLGAPVRPAPRPRLRLAPATVSTVEEPVARSLGELLAARLVQLGLIFVALTIVTLAMSLVAHAIR